MDKFDPQTGDVGQRWSIFDPEVVHFGPQLGHFEVQNCRWMELRTKTQILSFCVLLRIGHLGRKWSNSGPEIVHSDLKTASLASNLAVLASILVPRAVKIDIQATMAP